MGTRLGGIQFQLRSIGVIHSTLRTTRLRIGPMEAIDETPVVDIKPVLNYSRPR